MNHLNYDKLTFIQLFQFFIKVFIYIYKKVRGLIRSILEITKKDNKKGSLKHHIITKEEKEKNGQYGHEQSKKLSEDEKQRLVEYRKKYCKIKKNALL